MSKEKLKVLGQLLINASERGAELIEISGIEDIIDCQLLPHKPIERLRTGDMNITLKIRGL